MPHPVVESVNKCLICNATFSKPFTLKRHVESVHEGKKSYKCTQCDLKFKAKQNLKKHIAKVHEKPKEFEEDSEVKQEEYNSYDYEGIHLLLCLTL